MKQEKEAQGEVTGISEKYRGTDQVSSTRSLRYAFAGVHFGYPEIEYFQCKILQVEVESLVMIEVDGEVVGQSPG